MSRFTRIFVELKNREALSSLLAGLMASLAFAIATSTFFKKHEPSGDLTVQIQQVSTALADISRIADSLKSLKDDLQKTEAERARIEADYKRVSELKSVTESQFLAIRQALSHRTVWQTVGDNLVSFFLGVASSLVASGVWFYFRRRKE